MVRLSNELNWVKYDHFAEIKRLGSTTGDFVARIL